MTRSSRTRIIATNLEHNERFTQDIQSSVQRILGLNPTLTPAEALLEVQKEMLKNNPFVAPPDGRCIINTMLPVELLTYIFRLGVEMDREGEDEEFEEVTEGQERKDLEEELESDDDLEEDDGKELKVTLGLRDVEMEVVEDGGDDPEWEDEEPEAPMWSEDSDSETETETDTDEESDEEDEDPHIPFEILVSHVCRHWREAAVNTPELWSWIEFVAPPQWEMYEAYLERAKGHPLTLDIDGSRPDDYALEDHPDHPDYQPEHAEGEPILFYSSKQIQRIFDMLIPLASQWHRVDICMSNHSDMEYVLKRLHEIPEAPALETIHMHDEENPLTLPFHGKAPNLRSVDLWGVHIDWDAAAPLFTNLKHFNLAFHINRPSFKMFATYLRNAPRLELLELDTSGPQAKHSPLISPGHTAPIEADRERAEEADPWAWHAYPIEVPSLRELSLSGHEPDYACALAQTFFFPNLKGISISYPNGDFSNTIMAYATPSRRASSRRSMFQLIDSLQLLELGHVDDGARNTMFEALVGLKNLCLGAVDDEDEDEVSAAVAKFWTELYKNTLAVRKEEGGKAPAITQKEETDEGETKIPPKLLLPHLSAIQTRGIDGTTMRKFVDARKSLGLPLKTVMMHSGSDVLSKDEKWLRANVEEFDYFSDSDEEADDGDDEGDYLDVSVFGDEDDVSDLDDSGAEWIDEVDGDGGTEDEWTDEE
ncbi:hypothetical protein BKA70DRAFT_1559369 [Coprinopsis sp. MPI-PUGE-AT-0042]|nr:hypothetical protein BKA70DRAFT_1559369 [Coprinopsis sp. MPI-PUGE-AT-0042]